MSSNFTPTVTLGGNVAPNAVVFRIKNFFYPGGTTLNDFPLADEDNGEPLGYIHFHTTSPGDITLTGMDTSYLEHIGSNYTKLVFIKNDGPGNLVITQQDPLSKPNHQFDGLGGPSITLPPAVIGASLLVIYDPDLGFWQPGP